MEEQKETKSKDKNPFFNITTDEETATDVNLWFFWVCIAWTVLLMIAFYVNFFNPEYRINPIFNDIYWILIVTYTAHKEVHKWAGGVLKTHRPGEITVYLWWAHAAIMYGIDFFTQGRFEYNPELNNVCRYVAMIFFGNATSKLMRYRINGKNKQSPQ